MGNDASLTRRALMGGAAAAGAALTGCSWINPEPEPPHPLLGLWSGTRELLARYQAAIDAHPGLAERLTPLRDHHRAHVRELAKTIGPQASASPSADASPDAAVPGDEKAVLEQLRSAEKGAQAAATDACLKAKAAVAPLLGSIAACRATHRKVLA